MGEPPRPLLARAHRRAPCDASRLFGDYGIAAKARRPRLFLISLGFIAAAGFLGLHALATPSVLVDNNAGFEYATPVGLLLGGLFIAWSAQTLDDEAVDRVLARANLLLGAVLGLIALWAVFSLARIPPLRDSLSPERVELFQTAVGGAGVILYATGAWGYFKLYRQRRARLLFTLTLAFSLLAATMVVVAFALNWRVSWWEWHVLMFAAFLLMSLAARAEWYEERFATLYQEQTLLGTARSASCSADLQGYTSFTESHTPAEVVKMLNAYFDRLVPLMTDMGGVVHQIIGDASWSPSTNTETSRTTRYLPREPLWPYKQGQRGGGSRRGLASIPGRREHRRGDHGRRRRRAWSPQARRRGRSREPCRPSRSVPTVGQVVISETTYSRLPSGTQVEATEPLQLKGKAKAVQAYRLIALPNES